MHDKHATSVGWTWWMDSIEYCGSGSSLGIKSSKQYNSGSFSSSGKLKIECGIWQLIQISINSNTKLNQFWLYEDIN